jgi:hypothetical protein
MAKPEAARIYALRRAFAVDLHPNLRRTRPFGMRNIEAASL